MPSSATLSGNHVADGDEYVYLSWSVAEQDIVNNRSRITWQLGWHFTTYSCRGLRNASAVINGVTVYSNFAAGDGVHIFNSGHEHRPQLQIASGSIWISHNGDGTQTLTASAGMTGFSAQTSSGSSSWALPTIDRISSPPSTPVISNITQTSVFVEFTDATDGAPIDDREIGYGTSSSAPTTTISSDGSTEITGLNPMTTYYFWARTHNAAGYSDWSARATARTIAGARIKVGAEVKEAIPYIKVSGVWKLARPWIKVLGEWKETI